jgi:hypothetical protein
MRVGSSSRFETVGIGRRDCMLASKLINMRSNRYRKRDLLLVSTMGVAGVH